MPILFYWLSRVDDPGVRSSIASALGQRWIEKPAVDAIAAAIAKTLQEHPGSDGPDMDVQIMINAILSAASGMQLATVAKLGLDPRMGKFEKTPLIDLLGRRRSGDGADAMRLLLPGATPEQKAVAMKRLQANRSSAANELLADLGSSVARTRAKQAN